jgi:hypothetical protein
MFLARQFEMLALSMAMLAANPGQWDKRGQAAQQTAMRFSRSAFFACFEGVITLLPAPPASHPASLQWPAGVR